jgi:hypothetical protein
MRNYDHKTMLSSSGHEIGLRVRQLTGDGEVFLENGPEAKPAAVPTKTRGKKIVNNFILAECV